AVIVLNEYVVCVSPTTWQIFDLGSDLMVEAIALNGRLVLHSYDLAGLRRDDHEIVLTKGKVESISRLRIMAQGYLVIALLHHNRARLANRQDKGRGPGRHGFTQCDVRRG